MCLTGHTNADYGGDLDEHKSTSDYVLLLNNGDISWSSKKQTCIALSTMEAEFIVCSVMGYKKLFGYDNSLRI